MYWRIDYEVIALLMLLITLFAYKRKKRVIVWPESLFFWLLVASTASIIFNLGNVWLFSNRPDWLVLKQITVAAAGFCYCQIPFLMFSYLILFFQTTTGNKEYSRKAMAAYCVPMVLSCIYVVVSPFTRQSFIINKTGGLEVSYEAWLLVVHFLVYFFITLKELTSMERKPGRPRKPPLYLISGCYFLSSLAAVFRTRTIYTGIFTAAACMLLYYYLQELQDADVRNRRICELENQKRLLVEMTEEANIAKRRAEEADRAKSQFLANMSHEIRTPLNAILGMTELILRDDVSTRVKDSAINIRDAGESLMSIINDILDISKIESGKMEIHREAYHLRRMLRDVINIIVTRIRSKEVELIVDIDPGIPEFLFGDEMRVQQVLINLLNNSIKYTENGYIKLTLRYTQEGSSIVLFGDVEDTGVGMTEEEMERIFESFVRVENVQNQTIEGTGLGLTICKLSLELMGGKIDVKSLYGVGSKFSFALPQEIQEKGALVKLRRKEACRVLFMEPSIEQQGIIERIFGDFSIESDFAESVEDFIEKLQLKEYTHGFLPWEEYEKAKETIKTVLDRGLAELLVVKDFGDLIEESREIRVIQRPLYCVNLIEALNGEIYDYEKESRYKESFVAPKARVLLVDDNAVNLKVAAGLMEPYQLQIDTAVSGMECIELLKENQKYHIVFLDHMMPGMDGVETLHQIRKLGGYYYENLPVIALTANALKEAQLMFAREGFQDFISKPVDICILEEKLNQYLPEELKKPVMVADNSGGQEEFTIEGIDTAEGLRQWNGNIKKYMEILKVVYQNGQEKLPKMKEYMEQDDYRSYMIEAHSLKSVAGSIGAAELSHMAKEQEYAAREEDWGKLRATKDVFLECYETQLQAIGEVLEPEEDEMERKGILALEEAENHMKKAEALVKDYEDEAAIALLSELSGYQLPYYKEDIVVNIIDKLKRLDYKEARRLLENRRRVTDEEYIIGG